jgi:hypothetical protein
MKEEQVQQVLGALEVFFSQTFPDLNDHRAHERLLGEAFVHKRKLPYVAIGVGGKSSGKSSYAQTLMAVHGAMQSVVLSNGVNVRARGKALQIIDNGRREHFTRAFLQRLLDEGALVNIILVREIPPMSTDASALTSILNFRAQF